MKVNLDALIPREDLELEDEGNVAGTPPDRLTVSQLEPESGFMLPYLRKPDFQRETNDWDSKRVVKFLTSFLDGDLIPAIILWRSPSGMLFVIDGSHRLSALIAWVHDDYGDGKISKAFYEKAIPGDQLKLAEKTRKLIRKDIGAFEDFKLALNHPDKVKEVVATRAKRLASTSIQLQWVAGDVSTAETSFFNINQQQAPIEKTELILLESREKPNCISARAIFRAGMGHKYWSRFAEEKQRTIEVLAHDINETLFTPDFDPPIKTLDIPIGGKLSAAPALQIILEFVNIVNDVPATFKKDLSDDVDGSTTIQFLDRARDVARKINSNHPTSLGLHPVIYFYSTEGKYRVNSFFATTKLVIELEKRKRLKEFTGVRKAFEEFIKENEIYVHQITRRFRQAGGGYDKITNFFLAAIDLLSKGRSKSETINELLDSDEFSYLKELQDASVLTSPVFSANTKSAIYLKMANAPTCGICGGIIHTNSMNFDHIKRRAEGGEGTIDNGQLSHPFCNTVVKH